MASKRGTTKGVDVSQPHSTPNTPDNDGNTTNNTNKNNNNNNTSDNNTNNTNTTTMNTTLTVLRLCLCAALCSTLGGASAKFNLTNDTAGAAVQQWCQKSCTTLSDLGTALFSLPEDLAYVDNVHGSDYNHGDRDILLGSKRDDDIENNKNDNNENNNKNNNDDNNNPTPLNHHQETYLSLFLCPIVNILFKLFQILMTIGLNTIGLTFGLKASHHSSASLSTTVCTAFGFVLNTFVGWWWFGERVGGWYVVGLCLMLCGVALLTIDNNNQQREAEEQAEEQATRQLNNNHAVVGKEKVVDGGEKSIKQD